MSEPHTADLATRYRYRQEGAEQERERIIKLLEADCKDGIGDNLQGCFHEVAINLIKGEQK